MNRHIFGINLSPLEQFCLWFGIITFLWMKAS